MWSFCGGDYAQNNLKNEFSVPTVNNEMESLYALVQFLLTGIHNCVHKLLRASYLTTLKLLCTKIQVQTRVQESGSIWQESGEEILDRGALTNILLFPLATMCYISYYN